MRRGERNWCRSVSRVKRDVNPERLLSYTRTMTEWVAFTVEISERVAQVTLTGPGKGNAMGPDFWRELPEVFRELDADPQVRAVVRRAASQDYRLSAIVSGIVTSDAFRMQANGDSRTN